MSHELKLERVIDAPVAAVWRAWSEHGEEWLCPRPWRAEIVTQELRPGGRSEMVFRGPDGDEQPLSGIYLEVLPERLVVATDAVTADWHPAGPFMVRIDRFEDLSGGRTRYEAIARHWTEEARAGHEAMGFEAGWGASADQLAEVARRLAAE